MRTLLYFFGFFFISLSVNLSMALAQIDKKALEKEEAFELNEDVLRSDSLPNLELTLSEEEISLADEEKKQSSRRRNKQKRKIYFGIKTNGSFTKRGSSDITLELFRYVDMSYLMKDPYQQEIHYYDPKAKRIKTSNYYDLKAKIKKGQNLYLLHGQYQKLRNRQLREEGYYYKGLKHEKWKEFDRNFILIEKLEYDLGFSADSKITYYEGSDKIKEILPIQHGRIQGIYYRFHKNGVMAEKGNYNNNHKTGMWRQWYENRARKEDINYPRLWWEDKEPVLLRKWTDRGIMTYDIDRGGELKR